MRSEAHKFLHLSKKHMDDQTVKSKIQTSPLAGQLYRKFIISRVMFHLLELCRKSEMN